MFRQALALLLVFTLVSSGCASAAGGRVMPTRLATPNNQNQMADYVQRLPVGSRVKVERTSGQAVHGTLMSADAAVVIVQRATRIPEAPIRIPVSDISRMQIEERSSWVKAAVVGAAAGAAATLGIFALLAAAFAD